MRFLTLILLLPVYFNAYSQEQQVIPYSRLDAQYDCLSAHFKRSKLVPLPDSLGRFFKRDTCNNNGLIYIYDTLKKANEYKIPYIKHTRDSSNKLIFNGIRFRDSVIVCGDDIDHAIAFVNCYFEKGVQLLGNYQASVTFESNVFAQSLLIGMFQSKQGRIILSDFSEELTLKGNIFFGSCSVTNCWFQQAVLFNINYFKQLELSGCMFLKEWKSISNDVAHELAIRFINSHSSFLFMETRVHWGFRITNSWFEKDVAFTNCLLQGPKEEKDPLEALIYQCRFSKLLDFSNSKIGNACIWATIFDADSSALILSESLINSFELKYTALPYLLDLSNVQILDSGVVDLRKVETAKTQSNFSDGAHHLLKKNVSCYIYLDNTPLKNILLDYSNFMVASIYYDPCIRETEVLEQAIEVYPLERLQLTSKTGRIEQLLKKSGFYMMEQRVDRGIYPPFPNNAWHKKPEGMVNKETLYRLLLQKFEQENNSKSYAKLDVEYKKFRLLELDPSKFNTVIYYINKAWWGFGYKKSRIFLWALVFFLIFSAINVCMLSFLVNKVYVMENIARQLQLQKKLTATKIARLRLIEISLHPVVIQRANIIQVIQIIFTAIIDTLYNIHNKLEILLKYYRVVLLLSFVYTGVVFFGFKMEISKFRLKESFATCWIVIIYATGIICTGFIINLILN